MSGLLPLLFERVDPRNERRDYGDGFQLRSRELRNQVVSVCSRLIVGNAVSRPHSARSRARPHCSESSTGRSFAAVLPRASDWVGLPPRGEPPPDDRLSAAGGRRQRAWPPASRWRGEPVNELGTAQLIVIYHPGCASASSGI